MKKSIIVPLSICALTMTNCSEKQSKGIDQANLDPSVLPADNFYQYACGGWQAANPLPDEYSRYGSFDQLADNGLKQLHELVTSIDLDSVEAGSNSQKVGILFAQGMDSVTLNAQGANALQADLATINALDKAGIPAAMSSMPGISAFYSTGVEADLANASVNTMYLSQGGLGLGNRDYYLDSTEKSAEIREAYKKYLGEIAQLAGYDKASAQRLVDNTMKIETQLAQASRTRTQLRDIEANYNPMLVAALDKKYPNIKLAQYFSAEGINDIDTLIVGQPEFLEAMDKIIASTPIEALRDYMAAGYISSAAPYLSDDFINANFELSKVISGVEKQRPRWKRALSVPNNVLGEALGQVYVEKYFPESSKEKMLSLVGNLQTALGQHIDNLSWMSDATKAKAKEKLDNFHVKIGYPDKWRDYSELNISADNSYWDNVKNAILFENAYNLADYRKPVDTSRWYMTPQTVNAYYNPTTNEICFPAGILQPPFFDPEADDAINYGAIGVVIGHEMTHGFDDQGRQFDKDGNMANWWTEDDAKAFNELADKLVAQFDEVLITDSLYANGRLTLGENIADQGGLRVAHTAYHNSLGDTEAPMIEGLTPDQRFYLAYANVWAANIREAEKVNRTLNDPHSLGMNRVNVSLRNIEPFFMAFNIQEGSPMYRPDTERVIIW